MSSSQYFFELLTEEIPAWMLRSRLEDLEGQLTTLFSEFAGSAPNEGSIAADATSRRLFFKIDDLPVRQADRNEIVKGPPAKVAYDKSGNPSQALQGFLRKNNASIEQVLTEGDYIQLQRTVAGQPVAQVLQERIPRIVEGLRWPKMMRWSDGAHSYIRPIHSVVSILGGTLLPLSIFGIAAGSATRGHRTLAKRDVTVQSFEHYIDAMKDAHVVVRADVRVDEMRKRAAALAASVGGVPAEDESIWEQWRYLTEYPGVARAEFKEDFLRLPSEVLITVMRVHQKQLPIMKGEKLTSSFLAVSDNVDDSEGNIASGNSFVTNARFADAAFFYETDRRRKLESRIDDLAHLQFHEKLGNYADKTVRIEAIATQICQETGRDPKTAAAAARLCKTDLVTEMVKEFTDLQGKIGGIYAREEEYPQAVWEAVYDHYLPMNLEDSLPRNDAGAIVSLADKLDTLAGFFGLGFKPSGSKDPFALRRAAQGVVQILLNDGAWKIAIPLDRALDIALGEKRAGAKADLLAFFEERVRTLVEQLYGFAYDEVAAAMESGWQASLPDLVARASAFHEVREDAQFLSLLDSAKRIANITAGQTPADAGSQRLEDPVEKRLDELALSVGRQLDELIAQKDYVSALRSFAGMSTDLATFFEKVMVMAEDPALRDARISLLRRVGGLAARVGDVTKIVVDRREYRPK